MSHTESSFFFDFVDPLCYLAELALRAREVSGAALAERVGYELRPPPAPLTRPSHTMWVARWETVRRLDPGLPLAPPALVPWTRKAHELHILARSRGVGAEVRAAIFEAYFRRGRDIGRIDELVRIAEAVGLERTETKAALDVDKHEDDVLAARRRAEALGIVELPALLFAGKVVQGFHQLPDLSTLLVGPPPADADFQSETK
jgi:predicted DsbA family dithiol-disulfide isomerase